jgi:hypothetical protein
MNPIFLFEILVIVFSILTYSFMKLRKYRDVEKKFLLLFLSVLFFEFMSKPMWEFQKFNSWAYIWQDISWIIILGWVSIFFIAFMLVDGYLKTFSDKKKFWMYLLVIQVIVAPIESWLVQTGIKSYAPILANTFTGLKIPLTNVPLEILGAIPLFATLIICFYKYLNYLYIKK